MNTLSEKLQSYISKIDTAKNYGYYPIANLYWASLFLNKEKLDLKVTLEVEKNKSKSNNHYDLAVMVIHLSSPYLIRLCIPMPLLKHNIQLKFYRNAQHVPLKKHSRTIRGFNKNAASKIRKHLSNDNADRSLYDNAEDVLVDAFLIKNWCDSFLQGVVIDEY